MDVSSIDGVLHQLEDIIDWSKRRSSRLGYFPALYRQMTVQVSQGIQDGFFEDRQRMEAITVAFANRYFRALDDYRSGRRPPNSWRLAFGAAQRWWPIVSQHLLLGVNAHINLDLGVAVAECVPRERLSQAHGDFNRINDVIAGMLDKVQSELAMVWSSYRLFDWATGRTDERILNFSLTKARDHAWAIAEHLASRPKTDWASGVSALDARVERLGRLIVRPGFALRAWLKAVRLGELHPVVKVLEVLG